MASAQLFHDLLKTLPEESWPLVFPALRREPLVWGALQEADFRRAALQHLGDSPQAWTPANLGLLALGSDLRAETLRASRQALPPDLHIQLEQTVSRLQAGRELPLTLKSAMRLALAAHQQMLAPEALESHPLGRAALTCLFGLLPQPQALLEKITPEIGLHILLCQPLEDQPLASLLLFVLQATPNGDYLEVLNSIKEHRPGAAEILLSEVKSRRQRVRRKVRGLTGALRLPMLHLEKLLQQADLENASGDLEDVQQALQQARQTTEQLEAALAGEMALAAARSGNPNQALNLWRENQAAITPALSAAIALTLFRTGHDEAAQEIGASLENLSSEDAGILFTQALLAARRSEPAAARHAAQAALVALARAEDPPIPPADLIHLLLSHHLTDEAVRLGEQAVEAHPNQAEIAAALCDAFIAAGRPEEALTHAYLATALKPDAPVHRRRLAEALEHAQQFDEALQQRMKLLQQQPPTPPDLRAAARTALRAGRPDIATGLCRQLLTETPDDGIAIALLGKALLAQGEREEGRQKLEEAVRFAPLHSEPWLALADLYREEGDLQRAGDTLIRAQRAGVDSADILFALGTLHRQQSEASQAAEILGRAFQKARHDGRNASLALAICVEWGEVLLELGRHQQALECLESGLRLAPEHPRLLHLSALALWRMERRQESLPRFAAALQTHPAEEALLVDYAQALLEEDIHDQRAANLLQQALEINPQNHLASALLGQYYEHNEQPQKALDAYQHALGSPLGNNPHWKFALTLGIGRIALHLNQPETALAALESLEGVARHPQALQMLAEAYRANRLPEKALEVARQAVAAEGETLSQETALWFCNLAAAQNAFEDSLQILNNTLAQQPQNAELRLARARLLHQMDRDEEASIDLKRLLNLEGLSDQMLIETAQLCEALGDLSTARQALEQATSRMRLQAETTPSQQAHTLKHLAAVCTRLEDHHAALSALEEALTLQPASTELIAAKAIALQKSGRKEQAVDWLENQMPLVNTEASLLLQAAQANFNIGRFTRALQLAGQALELQPEHLEARLLAAQIAFDLLMPDRARALLAQIPTQAKPTVLLAQLHCLAGEVALHFGEEVNAAQALNTASAIAPAHLRTQTLQMRLHLRQGNGEIVPEAMKEVLILFGKRAQEITLAERLALATAALEGLYFDVALYLLRTSGHSLPPRQHLLLAKTLVLRAEHYRLCQAAHIQSNAPGAAAVADESYHEFENALLAVSRAVEQSPQEAAGERIPIQTELRIWMSRGKAVFQPSAEHAKALLNLPPHPDHQAACLAALRMAGETKAAAELARRLIGKEHHFSPPLWGQIALALARQDASLAAHAAEQALKEAIRTSYPVMPLYLALQATLAHRAGDRALLISAARRLLDRWENEPYWHMLLADVLSENQPPENVAAMQEAIEHFKRAIHLQPLNKTPYLKLGQLHMTMGQTENALAVLKNAIALDNQDSQLWLALAKVHHASGGLNEAARAAETACRLSPSASKCWLWRARIALDSDHPEQALEHIAQALRLHPGDIQALLLQAEALQALGRPAEALEVLQTVSARSLPNVELLLKIVHLRRQVEGAKAALKELEALYAQHHQEARLGLAFAEALAESGKTEAAIHTAQQTLGQVTQLSEDEQARLHYLLGRLLRRSGQLDQAIQALSDAVDIQPEWVAPYLELGRTYFERREYTQAIQTLQQALALEPTNAECAYWAGMAFKEIKDYGSAEHMLRKAAQMSPNDIRIHRQLGAVVALNLVHNKKSVFVKP